MSRSRKCSLSSLASSTLSSGSSSTASAEEFWSQFGPPAGRKRGKVWASFLSRSRHLQLLLNFCKLSPPQSTRLQYSSTLGATSSSQRSYSPCDNDKDEEDADYSDVYCADVTSIDCFQPSTCLKQSLAAPAWCGRPPAPLPRSQRLPPQPPPCRPPLLRPRDRRPRQYQQTLSQKAKGHREVERRPTLPPRGQPQAYPAPSRPTAGLPCTLRADLRPTLHPRD